MITAGTAAGIKKAYERGYREGWNDRDDRRGGWGRGHGHGHHH
jgi:hypothetical protein